MLVVAGHPQSQQPADEAAPQAEYDAFADAFEQEATDRADDRLGDEQQGENQDQRPQSPPLAGRVDRLLGQKRLCQSGSAADQREHERHRHGATVIGGQPEEVAHPGPAGQVLARTPAGHSHRRFGSGAGTATRRRK